jgi:photosystem II stability/assembly factor-like uncharacterized protein
MQQQNLLHTTKTKYLLLAVLSFFYISGFSQVDENLWRTYDNPQATFEELQESFNAYWKDRPYEKGKGYKQFKRWESYMGPRIYPSGDMSLPSTNYQNFMDWYETQPANLKTANNWSELGPFVKATGADTGVGRLNFVRFNPLKHSTMYVGAPDGGLWKSVNSGASWTTNTDFLPIIGVADLVIHPTDTMIMYLGTGDIEGDRFSMGVRKSTDGGTTWNTTGLTWVASDKYKISKVLMHPSNPLILLVATDGGVFRTTDGGESWGVGSPASPVSGITDFKDMEFKPGDPDVVYAAGKEIWKSTDNGATWTQVSTYNGLPDSTTVARIALAVTPADPTYVYAVIGNEVGSGLMGLYRSTNSGASFNVVTQTLPAKNILGYVTDGSDTGGQAFYDLAIAVAPDDANFVTVGGVNMWNSIDGGVNWTIMSHWDPDPNYQFVHADIHEISYMPGNLPANNMTFFACGDGGLSKTINDGATWTDISNNLRISQQTTIGISSTDPNKIVAGLQDIGTIYKPNSTLPITWNVIGGGDGEDCFIDWNDDNNIVISGTNGSHQLSINGGTSFNDIVSGLPAEQADFYSAIRQDPSVSTKFYAGGRKNLYVTNDAGANWTSTGPAPFTGGTYPEDNRIKEFTVVPNNNATIYAMNETKVAKSTDFGATWTDVTGSLPTGTTALSNLTVSSANPLHVWVTFSGYTTGVKVYKTTDGGTNWTNISGTLPNIPVNAIIYQKDSPNSDIYIGMDVGVYHIDNTTSTWASYFNLLPNARVRNLKIFYGGQGKLRAATYGRGTWETDLAVALPVELTSFKGENQDTKNVLYWNTATETNLDVYSIEKSLNGKSFETIGTVTPSTPNSIEPQSYTFTDLKPASGLNYYRLKIIDLDTKFEYSKIITVFVDEKASAISLYPNPTSSFVEIKGLADNETVNIRLIDALGRTMRFESITQSERVDVSNFPNGTYFIEITTENGSTIQRFIKQ